MAADCRFFRFKVIIPSFTIKFTAPVRSAGPTDPANAMLTHDQIWNALDRLAERAGLSASALAKRAGLDPTTFNKSKRITPDGRERWPSTESVAKALAATTRAPAAPKASMVFIEILPELLGFACGASIGAGSRARCD